MSRGSSKVVYVGNLPGDVRQREVEELFSKYGRIVEIDLKLPPRPPGYAFIEFEDARDAEDAIRGRDGYNFDGNKIRVELAHGGRGASAFGGGGAPRVSLVARSSEDLKDHMRKAGDVTFAQVFREGSGTCGIVDYATYDDMRYAIKKLDDSEFRNPFAKGYIRLAVATPTSPLAGAFSEPLPLPLPFALSLPLPRSGGARAGPFGLPLPPTKGGRAVAIGVAVIVVDGRLGNLVRFSEIFYF
eukprot:jgi/Mesvir1/16965/Mv15813-RA.1